MQESQVCMGCLMFEAIGGSKFCPCCNLFKEIAEQDLTSKIQQFEERYGVAFVRTDDVIELQDGDYEVVEDVVRNLTDDQTDVRAPAGLVLELDIE